MDKYLFKAVERDPIDGVVARMSKKEDDGTERDVFLNQDNVTDLLAAYEGNEGLGSIELATRRNLQTALSEIEGAKAFIAESGTSAEAQPTL